MGVDVRVKRIHEPTSRGDGYRVLVDRLWPRGVSRAKASLDEWLPDLAPSDELRRWYGHDPDRFQEFRRRYVRELGSRRGLLSDLRRRAREGRVTVLTATRDVERSNAAVVADALQRGLRD